MTQAVPSARWIKSSYSVPQGECVEVAASTSAALVRDSKRTTDAHLTIPSASWQEFVASQA